MVTQQILVLFFQVRVLVVQQSKSLLYEQAKGPHLSKSLNPEYFRLDLQQTS